MVEEDYHGLGIAGFIFRHLADRIAKYNQLLRIEEELGSSARFAGRAAFRQQFATGFMAMP